MDKYVYTKFAKNYEIFICDIGERIEDILKSFSEMVDYLSKDGTQPLTQEEVLEHNKRKFQLYMNAYKLGNEFNEYFFFKKDCLKKYSIEELYNKDIQFYKKLQEVYKEFADYFDELKSKYGDKLNDYWVDKVESKFKYFSIRMSGFDEIIEMKKGIQNR